MTWLAITEGVDERVDELQRQLAALTAEEREAEREVVQARQDLQRLEAESRDAERDDALARVEGRKATGRGKLHQELEDARHRPAQAEAKLTGRRRAVAAKTGELEHYIEANVDALLSSLSENRALDAQAALTGWLEEGKRLIADWIKVAQAGECIVGHVQARRGQQRTPDLPAEIDAIRRANITVEVPAPRPWRRPTLTVTMPAGAKGIDDISDRAERQRNSDSADLHRASKAFAAHERARAR